MIKKMKTNEGIQYKKLSPEEMKARGILGRLIGPCADFINPTRNGRGYSEQLWENVFKDPIMQEKIKNGVCFGELGHPADRTEVDMEKIAICLREQPCKNDKGQLIACFDILDTPNGRILKTLCDYGSTVGISSRGQGDLITDINGNEAVDPDTYECECWDVVLVPAVKEARMKYVTEGLDNKGLKLKKALTESLNKASEEEKKIMEETLENLNITLDESKEGKESEEIGEEEYLENAKKFCEHIKTLESKQEVLDIMEDYNFEEHAPEDEAEKLIYDALKARLTELEATEVPAVESLTEAKEEEEVPEETPVEEEPEVIETEETTIENEEVPAEEPEVIEEPVKETKSNEEVFLDFLANNFSEEQIKKACKILNIEIEEESEEEKPEETSEEEISTEKPVEEPEEGSNDESQENIPDEETTEEVPETEEATDSGATELIKGLQEALKSKSDLENSVKSLQEKLAAGDARVNELTEECDRYKKAVTRLAVLAKSNKDLKASVSKLEESLSQKDETIDAQQLRISRLVKSRKEHVDESASLNESLSSKATEINSLNTELKTLKEELSKKEKETSRKVDELTESLNKATTLKESYKKLANKIVNRYIEVKANMIGVTTTDVKRKLGESYSIEDVDKVCEDLKSYQLNVSKLPFEVNRKVGIRVNESTSKSNLVKSSTRSALNDDDVDDDLIRLANI